MCVLYNLSCFLFFFSTDTLCFPKRIHFTDTSAPPHRPPHVQGSPGTCAGDCGYRILPSLQGVPLHYILTNSVRQYTFFSENAWSAAYSDTYISIRYIRVGLPFVPVDFIPVCTAYPAVVSLSMIWFVWRIFTLRRSASSAAVISLFPRIPRMVFCGPSPEQALPSRQFPSNPRQGAPV